MKSGQFFQCRILIRRKGGKRAEAILVRPKFESFGPKQVGTWRLFYSLPVTGPFKNAEEKAMAKFVNLGFCGFNKFQLEISV